MGGEFIKLTLLFQPTTEAPDTKPTKPPTPAPRRSSRKRKRGDAAIDGSVVNIPHRDQRSDYQPNWADLLAFGNPDGNGFGMPLMHFVGVPYPFVHRRRISNAARGPIAIDDDSGHVIEDDEDNDDSGNDGSEPDIEEVRPGHRRSVRANGDDDRDLRYRGSSGRMRGTAIFQQIVARLHMLHNMVRPAPTPQTPPVPLRQIREGDRTIIDLTDDDPSPAAASSSNSVPTPPPRRHLSSIPPNSDVITILDDDEDDG